MLKKGATGPDVVRLQEMLLALGYPLPRWGADGSLGDETLRAVSLCLMDHGQLLDDDKNTVSGWELARIVAVFEARSQATLPAGVVDMRAQHAGVHRYAKRPWAKVKGITLHQTACHLGENPERWKDVGAHWGVTREGKAIYLSDPTWSVVHGNGFNNYDVGIEIDGTYEGVDGNVKTLWDYPDHKPMKPTPEAVEATKQIVRYTVALVAQHGGKVQFLHAHRQSSKDRQSDPGSALWQQVGLVLMDELKLTDGGKGFTTGSGLPIPGAWDARYKGVPY